MLNFIIELGLQIVGVGASSGLVYSDQSIYIISDNSSYLYQYNLENKKLDRFMLFESEVKENIPKKEKADFEAITKYEDDIYILSSGSKKKRNRLIHFNTKTKVTTEKDLTFLYEGLQSISGISSKDFNIEGVIYTGKEWYLFNRGNGANEQNGVFRITNTLMGNDNIIEYYPFTLPEINNYTAGFSDAVWVNDTIYFIATAEGAKSTFEDGAILGSMIGSISPETMQLKSTKKISDTQKFEGITLFKDNEKEISFLLCEDNDNEELKSQIYKVSIPKEF